MNPAAAFIDSLVDGSSGISDIEAIRTKTR
jgi:hypothetical protein